MTTNQQQSKIKAESKELIDEIKYASLIRKVNESKAKLETWRKYMKCDPPNYGKADMEIGGDEGLAVHYALILLDIDGDGKISVEEFEKYMESAHEVIAKQADFLLNTGIIGALFLSFLYPLMFQPITVSDLSSEFFGETGVSVIFHIYYILLTLSVGFAIVNVFFAARYYSSINFVIPSIEGRLEFTSDTPFFMIRLFGIWIVCFSVWMLPFGAAVSVGPSAALIAVIMAATFQFVGVNYYEFFKITCKAVAVSRREVMDHLDRCLLSNEHKSRMDTEMSPQLSPLSHRI